MKFEISDSDTLITQFARVRGNMQREQSINRDKIPNAVRRANEQPDASVASDDEIFRFVLAAGLSSDLFANGRCANSNLYLNAPANDRRAYRRWETLTISTNLPIGVEILAMIATPSDGPNWVVNSIHFGTYSVLNPCGEIGVPLSQMLCITTHDLLGVFAGKKTSVDVRLSMSLTCQTDDATFGGYSMLCYQEEVECQISTRLVPSKRLK